MKITNANTIRITMSLSDFSKLRLVLAIYLLSKCSRLLDDNHQRVLPVDG